MLDLSLGKNAKADNAIQICRQGIKAHSRQELVNNGGLKLWNKWVTRDLNPQPID